MEVRYGAIGLESRFISSFINYVRFMAVRSIPASTQVVMTELSASVVSAEARTLLYKGVVPVKFPDCVVKSLTSLSDLIRPSMSSTVLYAAPGA